MTVKMTSALGGMPACSLAAVALTLAHADEVLVPSGAQW